MHLFSRESFHSFSEVNLLKKSQTLQKAINLDFSHLRPFEAKHWNSLVIKAYCMASVFVFECFESSKLQKPIKIVYELHGISRAGKI